MRAHGGLHGEFNLIRKMQAEVRPKCDAMLQKVLFYVEQHREICSGL